MIVYYILIWFSPYQRHPWLGASLGGFSTIKFLGGLCLVTSILYLAVRRVPDPLLFRSSQVWSFMLLLMLATFSYVAGGAAYTAGVGNPILIYLSQAINLIITAILVDSWKRVRNVLLLAIGAVAYTSLHLIREWVAGHRVYANYRPGWVTGDANYFAATALLVIPVSVCFISRSYRFPVRLFAAGCLIIMLTAFILGGSRGSLVGLAAIVPVLIWHSKRRGRNILAFGVLSVAFSAVQLAIPRSPLDRLLHPVKGDEKALDFRAEMWHLAGRMIKDNPLFGVGLGGFGRNKTQYLEPGEKIKFVVAHNAYIEIAAEMGITGLLAFLTVLGSAFHTLRQIQKRARSALAQAPAGETDGVVRRQLENLGRWAAAMQAGLMGFCVSIFAFSGEYVKLFWLMIFISACMHVISTRLAERLTSARAGDMWATAGTVA